MFYSQFILAKKGPLGTIWIAAHLERKLRKNQVADTDIGVSVDSILSPEVPIALRLSSHLLLGVVKIYSRKVNYLFQDCSEAALKIKQAFRSSAVDLPPEESTAPYHSITLPETFHLDDFELPDSAFQGDCVDHHVSAKDQITLQDTVENTGILKLQFGLDERFGDGNASMIGLDLDEDVFVDKNASSPTALVTIFQDECTAYQGQVSSPVPVNEMNIDDYKNGVAKEIDTVASAQLSGFPNNSEKHIFSNVVDMTKNGITSDDQSYYIQTPNLNKIFISNNSVVMLPSITTDEVTSCDFNDCSHPPIASGLVEESFVASASKGCAFILQPKPSLMVVEEAAASHDSSSKLECSVLVTENNLIINRAMTNPDLSKPTSVCFQSTIQPPAVDKTQNQHEQKTSAEIVQDKTLISEPKDLPHDAQVTNVAAAPPNIAQLEVLVTSSSNGISNSRTILDPLICSKSPLVTGVAEANSDPSFCSKAQPSSCCNLKLVDVGIINNKPVNISDFHIKSCSEQANQYNTHSEDIETLAQHIPKVSPIELAVSSQISLNEEKRRQVNECLLENQGNDSCIPVVTNYIQEVQTNSENIVTEHARVGDLSAGFQELIEQDQLNCCATPEFSEPEKMLLAPPSDINEKVTDDGSPSRITSLSGKKRRLMDSATVQQNDISAKITSRTRIRKDNEYVPDDDDLLVSILVGKKSPLLRTESTLPPKPASIKHSRAAKRKILLDDATILHADAIRHQLISTNDIRRIRKKAPCTRPEIWMIQKSSIEDGIFSESMLTGLSADLYELFTREYDYVIAQNIVYLEALNEFDVSVSTEFVREASVDKEKDDRIPTVPESIFGENQEPFESASAAQGFNSMPENDVRERVCSVAGMSQIESSIDDTEYAKLADTTKDEDNPGVYVPMLSTISSGLESEASTTNLVADETQQVVDLFKNAVYHSDRNAKTMNQYVDASLENLSVTEDAITMVANSGSVDAAVLNDAQENSAVANTVESDVQMLSLGNNVPEVGAVSAEDLSTVVLDSCEDLVVKDVETAKLTSIGKQEGMNILLSDKMENEFVQNDLCNVTSSIMSSEGLQQDFTSLSQKNDEMANVSSIAGEGSSFLEKGNSVDLSAKKDCMDFLETADDNNTEFLNMDDEEDCNEELHNDFSNPDYAQPLENIGWSSRTRGVGEYLKKLFSEESGSQREIVTMDHLIAGKARKEASRMFFETLVLKTKDYIHVEQDKPFNLITIKPRSRLLKLEF